MKQPCLLIGCLSFLPRFTSRPTLFSHSNTKSRLSLALSVWQFKFWRPQNSAAKIDGSWVATAAIFQPVMEDCVLGKQHRSSFPQESMWRASQPLKLLYSDICWLISSISNNHKRYLLTFIDDFSRKIWVFFLKEKSDTFRMFQLFKTKVEKETGTSIWGLRTDRGGEFTSTEFIDLCATYGIHRQLTAAYTPQQNGVAKRKN